MSLCLSICMSKSQGILVHKSIDSLILLRLFWLIFLSYPSKEGPRKGDYLSHHQMASLQLNLAFLPPSKRLGMSPWRRQPAYPSRMSLILIKGFKSRLQSHWKKFKIYVYQCKFIIFVIEICRFYSTKWNIIEVLISKQVQSLPCISELSSTQQQSPKSGRNRIKGYIAILQTHFCLINYW